MPSGEVTVPASGISVVILSTSIFVRSPCYLLSVYEDYIVDMDRSITFAQVHGKMTSSTSQRQVFQGNKSHRLPSFCLVVAN